MLYNLKNHKGISMEEKSMEDLKLEAESLGITFSGNISKVKLQAKIDEFYEKESSGAVSESAIVEDAGNEITSKITSKEAAFKETIRRLRKEGAEPVVVKITMVDKREASTATDAYFNDGNFAMKVPLDVFVEMPRSLVEMAETAIALGHQTTDSGSVPKMSKKYVVEYKR